MHVRFLLPVLAALTLGAAHPAAVAAQETTGITSSLYLRVRPEFWDWFGTVAGDRYAYIGVQARGALLQQRTRWSWRVELESPALLGLPDDAILPPPQGQLGLGGTYFAANDSVDVAASLFLRQAFVRFGRPPKAGGPAARVGRFEFNDGLEIIPTDPTLAWLKRERISQRLIGLFGFSHVGRTFDGVHGTHDWGGRNATLLLVRPTVGVFDVRGWPDLDVGVGYASFTIPMKRKRLAGDARVFATHYRDYRDEASVVKVDNRPAAVRAADRDQIAISTLGAHWIESVRTGMGEIDVLLWGAAQVGEWGTQSHRGVAWATELGWQLDSFPRLRPWLRVGWYRTSGDDDPADDRHATYFSMVPTPRIYARFPFYTLMNLEDVFGSLILRPGKQVTARLDGHQLRLADGNDLWYIGGGPFERSTFGYVGRPANGRRQLAGLLDLSVDWRVTPRWTLVGYGALADGGIVTKQIYPTSKTARFAYLEAQFSR